MLASHFLRKACSNYKKEVLGFSPEAMDLLNGRDYPGNVRELAQIIENAVVLTDSNLILPVSSGNDINCSISFIASVMHVKRKR